MIGILIIEVYNFYKALELGVIKIIILILNLLLKIVRQGSFGN